MRKTFFGDEYQKIQNWIYEKKRNSILNKIKRISVPVEIVGSEYGGYYINTEYFNSDDHYSVLSFGVGEDLSFDEEMVTKHNAEVFAFDPTPKSYKYVKKHILYQNSMFHFLPYGLSNETKKQHFYLPKNQSYVSGSIHKQSAVSNDWIEVEMLSFMDIIKKINISHIDLLKMDIEGSEFDVIQQILNSKIKIPLICLEVHDRLFDKKTGLKNLRLLIDSFTRFNYVLVYISERKNEMTFLKQ